MKRVAALGLCWVAAAATPAAEATAATATPAAETRAGETPGEDPPRLSYMLHCMGCHLMDGRGMPPEVPSLAAVGYYLDVPDGRRYLVQVPGAAQSLLDDDELADVLNWILAELGGSSVETGFEPYTAAEVGRYRRQAPEDIGALRRRLAERMTR